MSALDQWKRGKAEAPKGCVVLVRDGDWYVAFGMDAASCASVLGMRMERRYGMDVVRIPWHAAELYLEKLLKAGKKVALGDPILARPLGKEGGAA